MDITIVDYPGFIVFLGTLPIPISESDLLPVYNPITAELTATGILKISDLLSFDVEPSINRVSEIVVIPGKIINQGDFAQGSLAGRLGWEVSGANIGIGVISDSYDNKGAAATDVTNNDLPERPIQMVLRPPSIMTLNFFGGGSDEGRAMAQIVHDVAPDAEIFFRSGFFGEFEFCCPDRCIYS